MLSLQKRYRNILLKMESCILIKNTIAADRPGMYPMLNRTDVTLHKLADDVIAPKMTRFEYFVVRT